MSRVLVPAAKAPLRNAAPPLLSPAPQRVQRLCKHKAGGECAKCAAVQRKERDGKPGRRKAHEVEAVLANPGRPLPPAVRQDMETRFGQDFGAVRIHDDAAGARAADAVDAEAFAHGNDIAFAPGRYDPDSSEGRWLLAHELAHTVQQSRGSQGVQQSGPLSDGALEREADTAASAALAYVPVPPLTPAPAQVARVAAKPKARKPRAKSAKISVGSLAYDVNVISGEQAVANIAEPVIELGVKPFYVPRMKGRRALNVLRGDPPAPLLKVPSDKGARSAVKQAREETQDLRTNWLRRVSWAPTDADAQWKACGGDKTFPNVKGVACHMDHILELQLGGGGHAENIQALDPGPNMTSGRMIREQLADLGTAIADDPKLNLEGADRDLMLRVRFSGAVLYGPDPEATKCVEIETKALQAGGTGNLLLKPGRQNYSLNLRGDVHVSVDSKLSAPIEGDDDNDALRLAYPGLILTKLDAPVKSVHALHARIDTETARLPLKVPKSQAKGIVLNASPTAPATLQSNKTSIPIELLFLSPGKITEVKVENDKTYWKGEVDPTHKFLPKLMIDYADQKLSISAGLSKEALEKKSPIPGAKITEASISIDLMPEFKPAGNLAFEFAPGGRKMLAASVKIFPENGALAADGKVTLFIPGVKDAGGEVKYRDGAWSMSAKLGVADLDIPFLKGGELTATYAKNAFSAQGKLDLALPGGGEGQLGLSYQGSRWVFTGHGKIVHDRFGTVSVALRDDGETFTATGKATVGLQKLGLTPQIDATFKKKRGEDAFKISGSGSLLINKGKLAGSIKVTLHETGAVTGEGKLSFPVRDNLMVEAGVAMDAKQVVTTTGSVKLTKPIDLFKPKGGNYQIKLLDLSFPIPGLSAGLVGMKFGIGCGIEAGYWFGPAQLKDVEIGGTVKPFEPDPDPALTLKGTLSVDAGAHLGFWIRGSLIADAGIAKATGSITVSAGIQAKGNASLISTVNYAKGVFSVSALAKASADLNLAFSVKAAIELTTILGDWGPGARWEWTLKEFMVPTGLKFAFSAPIGYHSVDGLTLPSAQNITWQPPERVDAGDLLTRILEAARKSEPPK